jgi:hypothetical protein
MVGWLRTVVGRCRGMVGGLKGVVGGLGSMVGRLRGVDGWLVVGAGARGVLRPQFQDRGLAWSRQFVRVKNRIEGKIGGEIVKIWEG